MIRVWVWRVGHPSNLGLRQVNGEDRRADLLPQQHFISKGSRSA